MFCADGDLAKRPPLKGGAAEQIYHQVLYNGAWPKLLVPTLREFLVERQYRLRTVV